MTSTVLCTVRDAIDWGYHLDAVCDAVDGEGNLCNNAFKLDAHALLEKHGEDFTLASIRSLVRCLRCGAGPPLVRVITPYGG